MEIENFFCDEDFMSDFDDLAIKLDIDEDNVKFLPEDFQIKVELSELEPIFKIDAKNLCQLLADNNEERLTDNYEEESEILNAIKQCVDFKKLTELLPKYYYPNNKFVTITKSDLVSWFK